MSFNSIWNPSTICKFLRVYIDDREIIADDMLSIEWRYNFFEFGVLGTLSIRDTYDISNSKTTQLLGNTVIKLSIMDCFGYSIIRYFKVLDQKFSETARERDITFIFVDEITYALMHSHAKDLKTTKFENKDIVTIFKTVCTELKLNTLCERNKLSFDFESPSEKVDILSIPANLSILDFFFEEMKKYNIRMWQDNSHFHVKEIKLSELKIGKKTIKTKTGKDIEIVFSNVNVNYNSIYHIHEYHKLQGNKISALPSRSVVRMIGKTKLVETVNLKDYAKSLVLNDNYEFTQIQEDSQISNSQISKTAGYQKYELFNSFIQANKVAIFVSGNIKELNIGNIVLTQFKDDSQFSENSLMGDATTSGKYFIGEITNKIVGDKFISRVVLTRFDNPKTRKI